MSKQKQSRLFLTILVLLMTMVIAACTQQASPEEKLFDIMEETVVVEEAFVAQQEPLQERERQESEYYNQIIELSLEEFDQIVEISDKALASVAERKELVMTEQEAIQSSQNTFAGAFDIVEGMEEGIAEEEARSLLDLMTKRYEAYDALNESYQQSLRLDQELYELFQDKELTLEALKAQIEEVNASYEDLSAKHDAFNDATNNYNEAKRTFYENAGLVDNEEAEV
ncbi:YkyA family protein [Bacillus fonticola]|uniref:YkyA family protein n=1 Tax=Bacillus fonticola TaxID=2728853 RepID=UPI0014728F90|nr:YkyA family protein [Bacillus fonticola]